LGSLLLSALALVLFSLSVFQLIKTRELLSGRPSKPSARTARIIEQRLQNSKDDVMQYSILGLTEGPDSRTRRTT